MNKRVHEIAKEQGLPAKELLAKLRAAGIEVKAASSSVDEAVALKALGNGGAPAAESGNGSEAPPAPTQAAPRRPRHSSLRRRLRPGRKARTVLPRSRSDPLSRLKAAGASVRPVTRCRASVPPGAPAGAAAS